LCLLQTSNKIFLLVVIFFIWFLLNTSILYLLFRFTIFYNVFHFVALITFPCILLYLWLLVSFHYVSIYIAIKISWSFIFIEIILSLPNIYKYISFFIYCFYTYFVVVLTFCRLISLTNWYDHHFVLSEYLWYYHQWIL